MSVCINNKIYSILQIEWEDAITSAEPGWTPFDDAIKEAGNPPPLMNTVGFCLYEDDAYIALTDSIGDNECGQLTKIPRAMIRKLEKLQGETNNEVLNEFDM